MLEPIVSFFEKLIDNFSWRRLSFLLALLVIAGMSAWGYEAYTQTFRLARIDQQAKLLEKLIALENNKTVARQPHLQRTYEGLQKQLASTITTSETEYELLPWAKNMLASGIAWVVFGLFLLLIPQSYTTAKSAPGAILFGMFAVAAPFVALSAAVPTFDTAWVNYTLYPIGHIVMLVAVILYIQNRKHRKFLAAIASLQPREPLAERDA